MKFSEVAFFTDNVDSVGDFYERLLDAKPAYRGPGIAIFQYRGTQILIHRFYAPGPQDPPCENHVGFAVADLDRAVRDLRSRNVTIQMPPKDYAWGRSAYLRGPDGKLIELHEQYDASEGKVDE